MKPKFFRQGLDENAITDSNSGDYFKFYTIKSGDIVLDVGANIGAFTLVASEKVGDSGHIYSFEPDDNNFHLLLSNTISLGNVTIQQTFASDVTGTVMFWNNPINPGNCSAYKNNLHGADKEVVCINIGKFAKEHRATFIKIDTEGSELSIINSIMQSGIRPHITFEAHDSMLYKGCRALLEHCGYDVNPKEVHVGVCYGTPLTALTL